VGDLSRRGLILAMLRKRVPTTGAAARFENDALNVGVVTLPSARVICGFNWSDRPNTFTAPLERPARVRDFWNDAAPGRHEGAVAVTNVAAHGARVRVCE
jgi:hypothetical protein